MVKLKGPLLSLSAHGTIAGILTFSDRKSGSQVRFQRPQVDYLNAARAQQRFWFASAESWWHILTPAEQAEWDPLG